MAGSPMQIVVISCVVFFSYITERVPATQRFGWINFRSLSLLLLVSKLPQTTKITGMEIERND